MLYILPVWICLVGDSRFLLLQSILGYEYEAEPYAQRTGRHALKRSMNLWCALLGRDHCQLPMWIAMRTVPRSDQVHDLQHPYGFLSEANEEECRMLFRARSPHAGRLGHLGHLRLLRNNLARPCGNSVLRGCAVDCATVVVF